MMRKIVFVIVCCLFAVSGSAQTDRGPISGKIIKTRNEPVVDAIIKFTLERSPTGFRRTTKSRPPDGKFSDEMPQGWVLVSVFKKEADGSIWVGEGRVKVDTNFGAVVPEIALKPQKGAASSNFEPTHGQSAVAAVVEGTLSDGRKALSGYVFVNDVVTGEELVATHVGSDGKYSFAVPGNNDYIFISMSEGQPSKHQIVHIAADTRIDIELTAN